MEKEELRKLVEEAGDAIINYKSPNSNKKKYNVCTLDFDNDHIRKKPNRAKETNDTLLMFCWDKDSYRLMKVDSVESVKPLSEILRNDP